MSGAKSRRRAEDVLHGLARSGRLRPPSQRPADGAADAQGDPLLAAPYLLPRILPLLQTRFPELRLGVAAKPRPRATGREDIKSGTLDAAMTGACRSARPTSIVIVLFEDLFLLAVPVRRSAPGGDARVAAEDIDSKPADPARGRPLPARSGAGVCATAARSRDSSAGRHGALAPAVLTTVMQMVAGGYRRDADDSADRRRRRTARRQSEVSAPEENPQPGRRIDVPRVPPHLARARRIFAALGEVVKQSMDITRRRRPRASARLTGSGPSSSRFRGR